MQVQLRSLSQDDFEFVHIVTRAAMQRYVEQTWGCWIDEEQRTQTYDSIDIATHQIIQIDGQDAGCLAVEECESYLQLTKLYLLPEFQGRGIGTGLIRQLIAKAKEIKKPIRLRVLAVNPAQRLYESEGFVIQIKTEERFYMEYKI